MEPTAAPAAKIYILNLDRAPERLRALTENLRGCPIPVERFPAVDGAKLTKEELEKLTQENHFYRPLIPNEIACYLSHCQCLEKFLQEGLDYCVILEDDSVPAPDFPATLLTLIEEHHAAKTTRETVSKNDAETDVGAAAAAWEILKISNCGTRYVKVGQSAGRSIVECQPVPSLALAIIWTPAAARKFLARYPFASRPFDMQFRFLWEHGICLQNICPNLVENSDCDSTIGGRDHLSTGFFSRFFYRANFIFRRFVHFARRHGLRRALALEFGDGK